MTPIWLDESSNPRPVQQCSRCGREAPVFRFREEHLRLVGWSLYTVASYTNWCGHGQEFIPVPEPWWLGAARAGRGGGGVATRWGGRRLARETNGWQAGSGPCRIRLGGLLIV